MVPGLSFTVDFTPAGRVTTTLLPVAQILGDSTSADGTRVPIAAG